jgi:DNA modification methylase
MKPVELFAYLIRNSSKPKDVVFDPFLGSGTSLIASDQENRVCLGFELSTKYASVICDRWEKLTGQTAEKVGNL